MTFDNKLPGEQKPYLIFLVYFTVPSMMLGWNNCRINVELYRFSTQRLAYHKLFTSGSSPQASLPPDFSNMSDFTIPELLIKRIIAQENKVPVISCDND